MNPSLNPPRTIPVSPDQFAALAPLFDAFTSSDRIAELTGLRARIQRVAGPNSKFENIITCLLAAIQKDRDPQDLLVRDLKKLSISSVSKNSPTVRRFLLRKDVSQTADMFEALFEHQKKLPSDAFQAFFLALKKVTHFYEMQKADDESLSRDLVRHGIDPQKIKVVSFTEVSRSLIEVAKFIASGLSCEPIPGCSLYDSVRYNLWRDFFASNDDPCTLTITLNKLLLSREFCALIFGEKELFASLVVAKNDCNQKDDQGYRPAHFAALFSSWDMLVMLKKLGADFTAQTAVGASVYDLLHARGHSISKLPKTITVFKDTALEMSQIQRIFSRSYTPMSFHSTTTLCEFWLHKVVVTKKEDLLSFQVPVFERFCQLKRSGQFYAPPVYVEPVRVDIGCTTPKFVLKAARTISPGEFIMECAGELASYVGQAGAESVVHSAKGLQGVWLNSAAQTNFSDLIASGPPTCDVFGVLIGGRYHLLCYSIVAIAKDSPLYLNYGKTSGHKDACDEASAVRIVDKYIEGSSNFTSFFQDVLLDKGILTTVILRSHEDKTDEYVVKTLPPPGVSINEFRLQIQHHRLMLKYLYYHPRHLFDRLDRKTLTIKTVLDAMNVCERILKKKGEFDEGYHNTLVRQILVFYQLSKEKELSREMFKKLFD